MVAVVKVEPFSGGLVIRNTNVEDAFKNGAFHPIPSPGLLGRNQSIVGENRVGNQEAYHFVPATAASAALARGILHRYGIDINAPENEVWLSPGEHNKTKTQGYISSVTTRLPAAEEAGGRSSA